MMSDKPIDNMCNETSFGDSQRKNDMKDETESAREYALNLADQSSPDTFSQRWTNQVNKIRAPILSSLHFVTNKAARNPKRTVLFIIMFSLALLLVGLSTNFKMEGDEDRLWTPTGSKSYEHGKWIDDESDFPDEPRTVLLFFHNDGKDALGVTQVGLIFDVVEGIQALDKYGTVCQNTTYTHPKTNETTCRVSGVLHFWDENRTEFNEDPRVLKTMAAEEFPDGSLTTSIYGYPESDAGGLTFVMSYLVSIDLPDTGASEDFESDVIDFVLDMDDKWRANDTNFRVDIETYRSFEDEFNRALMDDIPLLPMVFIIMSSFTTFVFYRRDRLYSRSFLGFCGVVCVLLSLVTGYGLMFVCGVTLTSMTQILPFIVFGIGLDDVFILTTSYDRTDRKKDPVDRIADTMDDVGLSIFMTSLTSTMAFGLGCLSTIPAIFWLCLYGFPTIAIVFLYQLTFFVACMVLDEDRIRAQRRDCCCCRKVAGTEDMEQDGDASAREPSKHFVDHLMSRYATLVLRPKSKVLVVILFVGLTIGLSFSTSQMTQDFDPKDLLPGDSYLKDLWDALDDYQERSGAIPFAYFRYVNQSLPGIQNDMEKYIDEIATLESVEEPPEEFWLRDFKVFNATLSDTDRPAHFDDQVKLFLSDPGYSDMYSDHIAFNDNGEITASRCRVYMDNVDWYHVKDQIDALKEQRALSRSQPINKGLSEWRFFMYFEMFDIWELYRVSVEELIKTTIIGVVAVTGIAFVLVPHWTAPLFVFPCMVLLYIDLIGFMQLAGLHINAISYIGLVMSIGLLVDFIMHCLLRYYESNQTNRTERTINMLETMGAAIFLGGASSLLGTLPLAFSTSDLFFNIFVVFFGLVTLGLAHGLILLPVILSTIGPQDVSITLADTRKPSSASSDSQREQP